MFDPRDQNPQFNGFRLPKFLPEEGVRELYEAATASVFELEMNYDVPGVTEYLTDLQVKAPPLLNLLPRYPGQDVQVHSLREAISLGAHEAEFPTRESYAQFQEGLGGSLLFLSSFDKTKPDVFLSSEEFDLCHICDLKVFGKECYRLAANALEEVYGTIDTLPSRIFMLYDECIEVLKQVRQQIR